MNFNDLQSTLAVLSHATLSDPMLALCNAIAWLDPLITSDEALTDIFYPLEEPNEWINIAIAWEVSRRCFPAVYAATTLELRNMPNGEQLAEQVCQGINQHLVGADMHDLDQIHWGLPFTSLALELHSAEFFNDSSHADLLPIYELLDVSFDSPHSIPDNFGSASMAARVLAISLRATGNTTHGSIAWLLDWMFAQTGNTVADYTDEEFYDMGIEPLPWEADEIEFN
ncbi:MAG: hypothetical protein K8I82_00025, partial [Anaerolineae bacterium]|nr:hypothetical protein [Anaerolineae bacterium]